MNIFSKDKQLSFDEMKDIANRLTSIRRTCATKDKRCIIANAIRLFTLVEKHDLYFAYFENNVTHTFPVDFSFTVSCINYEHYIDPNLGNPYVCNISFDHIDFEEIEAVPVVTLHPAHFRILAAIQTLYYSEENGMPEEKILECLQNMEMME